MTQDATDTAPDPQVWRQLKARLGLRPVLDAALPPVAFLAGLAAPGGSLLAGVLAALAVAALLSVVRLVRGEGLRPVLLSFLVVVLAAGLVRHSGQAVDFFLPELALNGALALWFGLSLLLRRPATATVLRLFGVRRIPDGQAANTAVWLGLWCLHLVLELPLYVAGNVLWLGIVRITTGPLLWLPAAWLGLRAARRSTARRAGGPIG